MRRLGLQGGLQVAHHVGLQERVTSSQELSRLVSGLSLRGNQRSELKTQNSFNVYLCLTFKQFNLVLNLI